MKSPVQISKRTTAGGAYKYEVLKDMAVAVENAAGVVGHNPTTVVRQVVQV